MDGRRGEGTRLTRRAEAEGGTAFCCLGGVAGVEGLGTAAEGMLSWCTRISLVVCNWFPPARLVHCSSGGSAFRKGRTDKLGGPRSVTGRVLVCCFVQRQASSSSLSWSRPFNSSRVHPSQVGDSRRDWGPHHAHLSGEWRVVHRRSFLSRQQAIPLSTAARNNSLYQCPHPLTPLFHPHPSPALPQTPTSPNPLARPSKTAKPAVEHDTPTLSAPAPPI